MGWFLSTSVNASEVNWDPWTLSCLSSRGRGGERFVDFAGHVALQAAYHFAFGQALPGAALDIGSGSLVDAHPADDDQVQGGVSLATAPNQT